MDYCHPCRRHLNGALACPGCGAPVEELRVYASEEAPRTDSYERYEETASAPEPAARETAEEAVRPGGRAATRRAARGRRGRVEEQYEPEGPEDEGFEGEGDDEADSAGVSRRDRKAAAHRRRRRRALFVTAGFLLAAGGLSLAELGLDAPGSSPAPAAAGDTKADGGAGEEAEESAEPVRDTADTVSDEASPSTSASPSPSESDKDKKGKGDKESEQPEDEATKDAQSGQTDGGLPPTTAPDPTPADPTPTPTPKPTRPDPDPEPEPEPTETCDRFLWWCT
ncbi:SCO2400 family protein [Streptomyces fuscus]|uniref:SCO2400 family protein n=1 Tax=Streptomyces fuscus TaxID=3048495 RepID=UPI003AFF8507